MSDMQYTYAVARIRSLELSLFSASTIEQLIACKSYDQALAFLTEKGWGDTDTPVEADAVLTRERQKIWETIGELSVDMSVFDVLSYPNLFHNLKAAIKEVCILGSHPEAFYSDVSIGREEMVRIIKEKDFTALPENMRDAAAKAYEALLHTRDGQLCDIIIDQATLKAIEQAGRAAKDAVIKDYAESTVAVTNIKIAVRSQKTAKSLEFMNQAMAVCDSLDITKLAHAALGSMEHICEYLMGTDYAAGAEALKESPSAFERWCDNRIIEAIRPQKYNPFSVGPLVAYVIARENEIKTVRIILSCKQNGFSDDMIRERVREMYV